LPKSKSSAVERLVRKYRKKFRDSGGYYEYQIDRRIAEDQIRAIIQQTARECAEIAAAQIETELPRHAEYNEGCRQVLDAIRDHFNLEGK